MQANPDSLISLAGEAARALGTTGGQLVLVLTPLISQIPAWKKFPFPSKLRWIVAVGGGALLGSGLLKDPLSGAIIGILGGYGWGAGKATGQFVGSFAKKGWLAIFD
jgi:hypothetical protein